MHLINLLNQHPQYITKKEEKMNKPLYLSILISIALFGCDSPTTVSANDTSSPVSLTTEVEEENNAEVPNGFDGVDTPTNTSSKNLALKSAIHNSPKVFYDKAAFSRSWSAPTLGKMAVKVTSITSTIPYAGTNGTMQLLVHTTCEENYDNDLIDGDHLLQLDDPDANDNDKGHLDYYYYYYSFGYYCTLEKFELVTESTDGWYPSELTIKIYTDNDRKEWSTVVNKWVDSNSSHEFYAQDWFTWNITDYSVLTDMTTGF